MPRPSGRSEGTSDGPASETAPRRPGRPRRPATDDAILTATLRLLISLGYRDLTIDAVAAGAGVGRPTIYRRWSSKAALVVAALARTPSLAPVPDTGSVRGDLLAIQAKQIALMNHSGFRSTVPGLVADLAADRGLAEIYYNEYVMPRQEPVRVAVERGVDRGELCDVDLAFLCELLVGPLFYRTVMEGQDLSPDLAEQTVTTVLARYGTGVGGGDPP